MALFFKYQVAEHKGMISNDYVGVFEFPPCLAPETILEMTASPSRAIAVLTANCIPCLS